MKRAIAGVACLVSMALPLQAADITWGSATAVSAASDVSTSGDLVEAFNIGSTAATDETVNGVLFAGKSDFLNNNSGSDFFNGDTGDAAYNALLSALDFGNGSDIFTKSVGGGNLEIGSKYLIQIWFADTRGLNVMQFGDGNGNTVDLDSVPGQYGIGTFTADGTSQDLTLDAQTMGNAHFTAYQIRQVPTSYQSDFANATNLTDAGLVNEGIASSGNWVFNQTDDRVEFDWLLRNGRAALYTTDSFQSDSGFTLAVSFLQRVAGSRFSIGLVDSGFSGSADGDWLNSALPAAYGVGLSTSGQVATDAGGDVLALNDGSTPKNDFTSITHLSTAQGNITFNTVQTLSMTVTSNSWSYSLNGAAATTGSFSTPLDTSKSYRVIAYIQESSAVRSEEVAANKMQGSYYSNIALTLYVPPPDGMVMSIR